jgi:glycosyltransferase involved in cell wall biosynthesis
VLLLPLDHPDPKIPGVDAIPCLRQGRWRRLRSLARACREVGAELLHSPVAAIGPRMGCPVVDTVHDLPFLVPELRGERGSGFAARMALHSAMGFAAAVVVPSTATAAALGRFARVGADRVRVIPHGVEPVAEPAPQADLVGPFLVLGDDRPRKNLEAVRRAHARARQIDVGLPELRLVGPGFGYLQEDDKWSVLRRANALFHLSLLEGFGLPVLEAFAHGVPVLCSDRGSLPEVAGDAALMLDPTDIEAIAQGMVRIHRDADLRRELRQRGRERAAQFTPAATAAAWQTLHEELLRR